MASHRGRVFKTTGDRFLAEFASVVDAARCASALQVARVCELRPGTTLRWFRERGGTARVSADRDYLTEGLRLAGLPE